LSENDRMKIYYDYSQGPYLPDPEDYETAAFWEGTRRGEIRFPRCQDCGQFHWYPCVLCPFCHSPNIKWQAVANKATLFTWTCVRRAIGPLYDIAQGPYIIALVEYDEAPGVYLVTNLVDCQPEDVYISMSLETVFQRINDTVVMPLVKPAG
jgi:uncharacterized OB-fold protein